MRMNIDRLLSLVHEVWFAESDYRLACCYPYDLKQDWRQFNEKRIQKYEALIKAEDCLNSVCDVLKMDQEQCERLWIAARAFYKWSEKWSWGRSMDERMAIQLGDWIFGEKSSNHFGIYRGGQSKSLDNTWSWDHDRRVLLKFESWLN